MNRNVMVLIAVFAVVIIAAIVFSLPLWKVPVEVTEIYYETELKQEAYWETEPYTVENIESASKTLIDKTYKYQPYPGNILTVKTDSFYVDKPDAVLFIKTVPSSFLFTPALFTVEGLEIEPSNWQHHSMESSEIEFRQVPQGEYYILLKTPYSDDPIYGSTKFTLPSTHTTIYMTWTENKGQITKNRLVQKYREIPVKVEKQQEMIKYQKCSFWYLLFSGNGKS
jgi:hypothetical protein